MSSGVTVETRRPHRDGRLYLTSGSLSAAIAPLGAELQSLRSSNGREWLWQGDPAYWSGRSPILFPVIGPNPNGHVSIGGQSFPMRSHGIARTSMFDLVDRDARSCRLRLVDTAQTRESFPRAFRVDIIFVLFEQTLAITAEIENTGPVVMPFSFGFHPGFPWPLPAASGKPHLLRLDDGAEPKMRRMDAQGFIGDAESSFFREGRMHLDPTQFERGAIIHEADWGNRIVFGVAGGPEVAITVAGLPSLGLWTRPGAPFLCIEPWHGLPVRAGAGDDIEERPGIIFLDAGDMRTMSLAIAVSG